MSTALPGHSAALTGLAGFASRPALWLARELRPAYFAGAQIARPRPFGRYGSPRCLRYGIASPRAAKQDGRETNRNGMDSSR
nr:MAG TPA: hypothetical protein [Caudoviricetes sp.]